MNYTVDISPSAWNQLATLPADDYRRIRAKLDTIANTLSTAQPPPSPLPTQEARDMEARASFLEGYAVLYDIDAERRRVTLLEVTQRFAQEE
jgi:mRNA-degrading endonuclease RelE of RelBE toxin-antitoxin system